MNLKENIDSLLYEINILVTEIKVLDNIVESSIDVNLNYTYLEKIIELGSEFDELSKELKLNLENYFKYEDLNNLPKDFNYKKLYKALVRQI